jgi:hypothetical protein
MELGNEHAYGQTWPNIAPCFDTFLTQKLFLKTEKNIWNHDQEINPLKNQTAQRKNDIK